ncbi:MAG: perosamine synthetase [Actinomycetota bacterium]|nr:perosamine synthetase [Actinomycetota bacterium]
MSGQPIQMSSADLDESDEQAIISAFRSGVLGLGPNSVEFERLCAERAGTKHAIAVSSGTAALHLIMQALRFGAADEVLVPSFTFAASVNAIIYTGATPVFVDIEPEYYNLDPTELIARRTPNTTGVMVVDIFGHPADWEAIQLAAPDLALIDDCCEAIGATYNGSPLGSLGQAGAFAFYPNKQITTGEGGMIVTDNDELARVCRSLRNQGRGEMGAWLEHERLGYNYRMDEMSAALGASQIKRLDTFMAKREAVAAMYTERLKPRDWVRTQRVDRTSTMSWFVYVVTLAAEVDRDKVIQSMADQGIPARAYFSPIHLQPYIKERFGTKGGMLPVTEDIAARTVALPFHNNLTEEQVERVLSAMESAVAR